MPTGTAETISYNPFVYPEEDNFTGVGTSGDTLELLPHQVPYSAEGFEMLADQSDWSDLELEALRNAGRFVRWAAQTGGISEYNVVTNRLSLQRSIVLDLRDHSKLVDDKEEK